MLVRGPPARIDNDVDPLTHSLVGAALAQSSRRRLSLAESGALLIGANLPDLDALTYFIGQDEAFGFRRGWTHGPAGLVAGAPLLAIGLLAVDRFVRRVRREQGEGPALSSLLCLAAIAIATHPLLDWLNTYGVRFLMPFSDRWFYGDALFIIDPWVWLLLGGGVFLSRAAIGALEALGWMALTLIASAMILLTGLAPAGARLIWIAGVLAIVTARVMLSVRTPRLARVSLVIAACYAAAMVAMSWTVSALIARHFPQAEETARLEMIMADTAPLEALMVGPTPGNPLRWDVVAQTRNGYRLGNWHWLSRPELVMEGDLIGKPPATPIIREALAAPEVRGTMRWMRFPFVDVEPDSAEPDRWVVRIMDLRYVRNRREGFGVAKVTVEGAP